MKNILVVGAGHMGSALIGSWIVNTKFKIDVLDPKKNKYILKKYKKQINFFTDIAQINDINKYQIIENGAGEKVLKITEADESTNTLKVKMLTGNRVSIARFI